RKFCAAGSEDPDLFLEQRFAFEVGLRHVGAGDGNIQPVVQYGPRQLIADVFPDLDPNIGPFLQEGMHGRTKGSVDECRWAPDTKMSGRTKREIAELILQLVEASDLELSFLQ